MSNDLDQQAILRIISDLDNQLKKDNVTMTLVILGYSAIVVSCVSRRGTEDIDTFETRPLKYLKTFGFHVLTEQSQNLLPSYKSRLIRIDNAFTNLTAYALSPYDIALLKIDQNRKKDQLDVADLLRQRVIDQKTMDVLFREWKNYFYPYDDSVVEAYNAIKRMV